VFWLTLWGGLRIDWQTNALYAYGWSVPLAAGMLFVARWRDRIRSELLGPGVRVTVFAGLIMLVILQVPFRVVAEANPEWRLLFWIRELQCALLTLGWIAIVGGWGWIRQFSFPVLFTVLAVPWPRFLEDFTVQTLTRAVTATTVEGLFLLGIPSLQSGNLILTGSGPISIEEACSGVRSLQTCLMLSILLGGLWKLSLNRRLLGVGFGIVVAFVLNFSRTFTLSLIFIADGQTAFDRWHGPLAAGEMAVCILGVVSAIWWIAGNRARLVDAPRFGYFLTSLQSSTTPTRALRIIFSTVALSTWLLSEVGTETWYRLHETGLRLQPTWTVAMAPRDAKEFAHFAVREISGRTEEILRTDEGFSLVWQTQDGSADWQITFLRWPPGHAAAVSATAHHPDVCFAAAGLEYLAELEPIRVTVGGVSFSFHHYLFRAGTRLLHAFYSLSENDTVTPEDFGRFEVNSWDRIQFAAAGRRNHGQSALWLSCLTDSIHGEKAIIALPNILKNLIRRLPDAEPVTPIW
jgi:exosortase